MKKVNFLNYGLTAMIMAFAMTLCYSCSSDDDEETGGNKEPRKTEQYVDLGLSVKWATCNVGATKPEEFGDYFAWGETDPHYNGNPLNPSSWKSDIYESEWYSFACYKYCDAETEGITKYCVHKSYGYNGFMDGKTVLEMEDDAAHVKLGGNWRMPTSEEMKELIKECSWEYTTLNGVKGYKVQSKKTGYTDKWIFLPEAGGYDYQEFAKGIGGYWSASLSTTESDWAYSLCFRGTMKSGAGSCRSIGMSVRPVLGSGNTQQELEKEVIPYSKVDGNINGHDYVELVGIKWATENVGKVNGIEAEATDNTFYYYQRGYGSEAANSWGNWALPMKKQWQKLIDECDWTWKEDCSFRGKHVSGYIVSEKNDSSKFIFLPAAGDYYKFSGYSCYWATSSFTTWLRFNAKGQELTHSSVTPDFCAVRPVVVDSGNIIQPSKVDGQDNGHDYVELAGLKWATENIGAVIGVSAVNKDETYGYFYTQDNAKNVAASWGGNWTLPTSEQWQKLIDECDWTRNKDCSFGGKTMTGYIVSDKKDSSKYIFLPAAGNCTYRSVGSQGILGNYWSSTTKTDYSYVIEFDFTDIKIIGTTGSGHGMSVRPVSK